MNWTSTKVPLWQVDCEEYRKLHRLFELRDVGPEHEAFIQTYAERFDLEIKRDGSRVTFTPKK